MFVTECSIYEKKDQHHNRNWYAIEQQCGLDSWALEMYFQGYKKYICQSKSSESVQKL